MPQDMYDRAIKMLAQEKREEFLRMQDLEKEKLNVDWETIHKTEGKKAYQQLYWKARNAAFRKLKERYRKDYYRLVLVARKEGYGTGYTPKS